MPPLPVSVYEGNAGTHWIVLSTFLPVQNVRKKQYLKVGGTQSSRTDVRIHSEIIILNTTERTQQHDTVWEESDGLEYSQEPDPHTWEFHVQQQGYNKQITGTNVYCPIHAATHLSHSISILAIYWLLKYTSF